MKKTEIKEAIERLDELKETAYRALNEMKEILREVLSEVAPDEYEAVERYWLAHIDGPLESRSPWLGGRSMISYIDATIETLEEIMEEQED